MINYIGSKKLLLSALHKIFDKYLTASSTFGDLFAGTGCVARSVLENYQCNVIANDVQYYSFVINKAQMSTYTKNDLVIIQVKLEEYNKLSGKNGFITINYAPPKRSYFTFENARKIDAIRSKLEKDRVSLPSNVYFYLLATLVMAADKIANVAAVYGSYLKTFKKSSLKTLELLPFNVSNIKRGNVLNCDIFDNQIIKQKYDVVYLDPPYTGRQYSQYYHILETIAKYDNPEIFGKTGRPIQQYQSPFSLKNRMLTSLQDLVSKLNTKVIIMSYSSSGTLSLKEIKSLFTNDYKLVKFVKIKHKSYHSQLNIDPFLFEYIFVAIRVQY